MCSSFPVLHPPQPLALAKARLGSISPVLWISKPQPSNLIPFPHSLFSFPINPNLYHQFQNLILQFRFPFPILYLHNFIPSLSYPIWLRPCSTPQMYGSAVTLLQGVLMRLSREVRRAPTQVFTPPPPLDLSSVAFIAFGDLVAGGSYLTSFSFVCDCCPVQLVFSESCWSRRFHHLCGFGWITISRQCFGDGSSSRIVGFFCFWAWNFVLCFVLGSISFCVPFMQLGLFFYNYDVLAINLQFDKRNTQPYCFCSYACIYEDIGCCHTSKS